MPGERGPVKPPRALRLVPNAAELEAAKAVSVADEVRPGAPTKPEGMSDEESVLWDDLVPKLDDNGMVTELDGLTIDLYLRHYLVAKRASDEMADKGLMVFDEKNERWQKTPLEMIFRSHSAEALRYAGQLGLTLVSRARMQAKGEDDGDTENPFTSPAQAQ